MALLWAGVRTHSTKGLMGKSCVSMASIGTKTPLLSSSTRTTGTDGAEVQGGNLLEMEKKERKCGGGGREAKNNLVLKMNITG